MAATVVNATAVVETALTSGIQMDTCHGKIPDKCTFIPTCRNIHFPAPPYKMDRVMSRIIKRLYNYSTGLAIEVDKTKLTVKSMNVDMKSPANIVWTVEYDTNGTHVVSNYRTKQAFFDLILRSSIRLSDGADELKQEGTTITFTVVASQVMLSVISTWLRKEHRNRFTRSDKVILWSLGAVSVLAVFGTMVLVERGARNDRAKEVAAYVAMGQTPPAVAPARGFWNRVLAVPFPTLAS